MNDDSIIRDASTTPHRRGFLRHASLGGAAGAALLLTSRPAEAGDDDDDDGRKGFSRQDRREASRIFREIQRHENAHVAFLVNALGAAARPKPSFRYLLQPNFRKFVQLSQTLENVGVGAYLGAAPVLSSRALLAAAGSIAFVEARHAGWLNSFVGVPITTDVNGAEQSFDTSLTGSQVENLASPLIADLNGGPLVNYSMTPSAENDILILNFALGLEYLEAEFYNVNQGYY